MRLAVSSIYQAESEFLVEEVSSLNIRVSAKGPIFIFVDEIHTVLWKIAALLRRGNKDIGYRHITVNIGSEEVSTRHRHG